MSDSECRAAFAVDLGAGKARHVDASLDEACACEAGSLSEHSPGVVAEEEYLLRIVVDPCQVTDKDGTPRPRSTIFSEAMTCGASCLRERHADADQLDVTVRELLDARPRDPAGKARGVFGVIRFPAHLARGIVEPDPPAPDAQRRFCVYDTARPDVTSHADVMFTADRQPGRSKQEKFRERLYKAAVGGFVPVEAFMGGILTKYSAANREAVLRARGH